MQIGGDPARRVESARRHLDLKSHVGLRFDREKPLGDLELRASRRQNPVAPGRNDDVGRIVRRSTERDMVPSPDRLGLHFAECETQEIVVQSRVVGPFDAGED